MRLVVFEDDSSSGLAPLTMLKHTSYLRWGTRTLLESVQQNVLDATGLVLWGREELGASVRESDKVAYNEPAEKWTTFVNGRARPGKALQLLLARKAPFAALSRGELVAAKLDGSRLSPGVMTKKTAAKAKAAPTRHASVEAHLAHLFMMPFDAGGRLWCRFGLLMPRWGWSTTDAQER